MDAKEQLKNNILIQMKSHLNKTTLNILTDVLIKELLHVEITKMECLPSLDIDINQEIINLFMFTKGSKLSEKTVEYYMYTIKHFIDIIQKPLNKINSLDVEYYLSQISKNNSMKSLNNHRKNLSAFFTWMRKQKIILENPCENVEPFKEVVKPIDHMEPEEYELLKAGCKHSRDRALIEFLRSTALRVGEIPNIKVSDVDWKNGTILVYGEKGREYREVCIDSVAEQYLQIYLQDRNIRNLNYCNEPLFKSLKGKEKLSRSGIRSSLVSIAENANVQRRIYPHLFRKTTATQIVKRGGSINDAGDYLGHRDRTTAGRFYAYKGSEHIQNIFKKYIAIV